MIYIRKLLKNEPGNKQAVELETLIEKALKKGKGSFCNVTLCKCSVDPKQSLMSTCLPDGLVGMAIVGGIGLGVAGLAGLIGLAVSKGAAKS